MDQTTKPGWEQRLRETGAQVEQEVERLITYMNDEVVPDIRRNSSQALRAAAAELARLAHKLDEQAAATPPPPPPAGDPHL